MEGNIRVKIIQHQRLEMVQSEVNKFCDSVRVHAKNYNVQLTTLRGGTYGEYAAMITV